MKDLSVLQVERPWGNFRQFTHNDPSTVKLITVKSGEELSLQSHTKRSEFWHVIVGNGIVQIGDEKFTAHEGDEYTIPVGSKHRLQALTEMIVLEIATGEFDEDGDIIRYEDKYGRVN